MTTSSDLHGLESFRIKHDDKFFSRLLSKESSRANPSFRVYYGDLSSAVPFMWEARPGTPKHTFSDNSLPPLTPPPSYYSTSINTRATKKHSRSRFLNALFMKNHHNYKSQMPSSPSSSSSFSSLSWSSSPHSSASGPISSTTPSSSCKRRRFSSWGSSFDDGADHQEEEAADGSCTPGMCFGINRNHSGLRVGYSVVMKKALLSIVGCASAARVTPPKSANAI